MVNKTSSGFILLSSDRATDPDSIRTDFAHEFFHVLQFRHNQAAMSASTGVVVNGRTLFWNSWFVEASATWAEWEYVPATSPEEVHWRFAADFQPSRASLSSDSPSAHMYASYIWPFFAEQEKGPSSIFQAWVAAEGATDPDGITDAVEQQLSFQTHFRDFAVRNWNKDLPGHPIAVLYKDLEATDGSSPPFPAATPPFATSFQLPLTSTKVTTVNLSLAAQYDEITFEPDVRKVILKFDKLPASIDVDLLVEIDGGSWNLERVDKDTPVVYCRDHEDENVSRIIVITSNHEKTRFDIRERRLRDRGQARLLRRARGRHRLEGARLGELLVLGDADRGHRHPGLRHQPELRDLRRPDAGVPAVWGVPGGFFHRIGLGARPGREPRGGQDLFPNTQDGAGGLAHDTGLGLSIDLQKCTFTFAARATIEVINNYDTTTPFVDLVGIARALGTHSLTAFTDRLSGSASFPAHSVDWNLTHFDGDAYIVGGLGGGWFNVSGLENAAGSAQITWDFQPDPPLPSPAVTTPDPPR